MFENLQDRNSIINWFKYFLPNRTIKCIEVTDILYQNYDNEAKDMLSANEYIFIKSVNKGLSTIIKSYDLFDHSSDIISYIKKEMMNKQQYLLAQKINLAKDRYGNIEVRFVVFNNKVVNYSRYIHSLKHNICKDFIVKAEEIINTMAIKEDFPDSYILDLGLAMVNNESYIDVIEFNPLSTSLCYVNNSIFSELPLDHFRYIQTHGFGIEYYFDMLKHPQGYSLI